MTVESIIQLAQIGLKVASSLAGYFGDDGFMIKDGKMIDLGEYTVEDMRKVLEDAGARFDTLQAMDDLLSNSDG